MGSATWVRMDALVPYLADYTLIKVGDYHMYFLNGSPNIRWENIP